MYLVLKLLFFKSILFLHGYAPFTPITYKDVWVGVDIPRLLDAIRMIESSGESMAVSHLGAIGAYQIMPGEHGALEYYNRFTGNNLQPYHMFCEIKSRKVAKFYLRNSLKLFNNNLEVAVSAYNMGMGNSMKSNINHRYVKKVLGIYHKRDT